MKKAVVSVSSIALAVVMGVGLVGCGDNTPSAADIESDRVTAEEWEAAFADENFENVKIVFTMRIDGLEGTSAEGSGNIATNTYFVDGNKGYDKGIATSFGEKPEFSAYEREFYYYVEGGTKTVYLLSADGNWTTGQSSGLTPAQVLISKIRYNAVNYEFEYDEESKGYVGDMYTYSTILKFQKGKLVACIQYDGRGNYKYYNEIITTYGGQTVTLPEVEIL